MRKPLCPTLDRFLEDRARLSYGARKAEDLDAKLRPEIARIEARIADSFRANVAASSDAFVPDDMATVLRNLMRSNGCR